MTEPQRFSRRRFLGSAAAGSLAVAGLGAFAPRALSGASPQALGERLVPPGKLALQQFSLRDAVTRRGIAASNAAGVAPTMGYLGGPSFPDDPTDLGPLVPLPGGFAEVFEYLASVGYKGFEFFQFSQGANGAITTQEIRTALDNAGLQSIGSHTGSIGNLFNPVTKAQQLEIASILGHTLLGAAGDPSGRDTLSDSPTNPNQIGWQTAADRANAIVAELAPLGMKWYWHPEQNSCRFFNDPAHPELATVRRIDWWAENVPGSFFEPDILHGLASRHRFPAPDGSRWDFYGFWTTNAHRVIGWHAKDGTRIVPPTAPGVNPFTQTIQRTPTFTDAIVALEGSIGIGYPVDPDPAVPGFKKLFQDVAAKGSHYVFVESDSGPGPASDPGRSLRHAKISAQNLLGLRGGTSAKHQSSSVEESPFESEAQVG